MNDQKQELKDFWNDASCGEDLYLKGFEKSDYDFQASERYRLEPILEFAKFDSFRGKKTLEIGVGLGADHQQLYTAGALLTGIDLTERAINHTKRRFELNGFDAKLMKADAENLPFENSSFDAVYSWGVIHHSPNTHLIVEEIYRILKDNGIAKIMIYYKYSIIGFMLWMRYGLFSLKPFTSLDQIYFHHLESIGTKAYSYSEAKALFNKFEVIDISSPLTHGDLLESPVGQRHRGFFLSLARRIWPRKLLKILFPNSGLFLMLTVKKISV